MELPLTIALTTYNRRAWLEQAIRGALSQTFEDFELLILDRGSDDGTPELVLSFKDPRIRYVRNPPGTSRAFNGISTMHIARGRYLLIAHDDDIFLPGLARRQMDMLAAHPEMAAVGVNSNLMNEDGTLSGNTLFTLRSDRVFGPGEYTRNVLEERLWIIVAGLLIKRRMIPRSAIEEFYYGVPRSRVRRETRDATSEMNLLCYMNRKHSIGLLAEPLMNYRQHSGQDSRTYDVFRPVVDLVTELKEAARHNRMGPETMAVLEAFRYRYRAQALLGTCRNLRPAAEVLRRLKTWREKMEALAAAPAPRNALLPVGILLHQLGLGPAADPWMKVHPDPAPFRNVATRALAAWLELRAAGRNFLDGVPYRRIAVFGSVFIAALLIQEARERGLEVVACLDSNTGRQGDQLLGVPILAPQELPGIAQGLDAVIVSSEKDHLSVFEAILTKACPGFQGEIRSWLDLAPGLERDESRTRGK